jgi:hypothetical protein
MPSTGMPPAGLAGILPQLKQDQHNLPVQVAWTGRM